MIDAPPPETASSAHVTVCENLRLMEHSRGLSGSAAKERSEDPLRLMSRTGRAKEWARPYSVGVKRRLCIAMALVCELQVFFIMCCGYIDMGMIMGSLVSSKHVGFAYMIVLFPTIFSRAWMPVDLMGDGFNRVVHLFPFAHTLDATRAIMIDGVGFSDIATGFLWVLGYSVAFLALGILAFRRRMVE